jgi:Glycosyl hydrolase family 26
VGLISANSKTPALYVLAGAGNVAMTNLAAAQTATGVTFSCLEVFNTNVPNWTDWEQPWFANDPSQGYTAWVAADPSNRQLIVSYNLISQQGGSMADPLTWETAGAAGAFNAHATALATNLVANGLGSSIIRMGLEANGNWNIDSIGGTAPGGGTVQMRTLWAQTWQQEIAAMKAVPGANFLFCWCPNAVVAGVPFADYYPGDSFVDIIGIDAYDAFANGTQPAPSAATTTALFGQAYGLTDITNFAHSHSKPLGLGEWGTQLGGTSGGLGDDPFYVQGIAAWVAANNVAFHCYFDSATDGIIPLSSSFPLTLAAYSAAFATTPGAPTVTTTAATGVAATAAVLNGTVNPRTAATTYQFEYGTTTSYGTAVPATPGSAGSGSAAVAESYSLAGLTASTTYHYRLNATNSFGTTHGADQAFTTTSAGGGGVPMTVSAAIDNFNDGGALKVFAVTGVTETGGASGQLQAFGPAADTVSVTPAASGSFIMFGVFERNTVALTAAANNTFTDTGAIGTAYTYAEGRYTGTVTGGSPVTAGSSTAPNDWNDIVAYELKSSGTPAVDGSTPAVVTGLASPLVTATFTPPGGAVLCAVVMSSVTGTAASTITITDNSGLGLVWTRRAVVTQTGSYAGVAAIFTATVPAGSPSGSASTGVTITPSATGSKGGGSIGRGQVSGLGQVAGGSGTVCTATWSVNPAAGSSILLFVQSGLPALQPTSVVDNGTTPATFTLDASNTSVNGTGCYIYRADNITLPASGSYTVTVTDSATRTIQAMGVEYIGKKAGGPDATGTNSSAGSTSVTTGSATPTSANGLVFGGFTDLTGLNPETITFTGSAPQTSQFTGTNGANWSAVGVADALTGSAQNFSWTLGDSVGWAGVAVAYSPPVTVFSGSPSTGITTGHSATGTPRIAVARTTGITITPSATGTRGGVGAPSTGVTITPSATGLAGVPAGPPVFPGKPLGVKIELNLNGTWTDVTAYLYQRNPVQITNMGRADWTSTLQAAQLTLTLDNRDGRFTPKNSAGAFYPYIARNVQLRLSVSSQSVTGAAYTGYRFCGEVTAWPPKWDPSGRDIYCDITAAGIWERMSQLITTLGSAYRRYYAGQAGGAAPRAYWPCEDGTGSTGLIPYASAAGTPPATWAFVSTGSGLSLAANSDFKGSDAIVQLNAAAITFTVPAGGTATNNFTRFLMSVPKNGDSASGTTNWNLLEVDSAGTVAKFEVYLNATGTLLMQLRNSGGTVIAQGTTTTNVKGQPYLVSAELAPSGGNVLFALSLIKPGSTTITETISGTLTTATVGAISAVKISRAMQLMDTAIGHLAVFYGTPPTLVNSQFPLNGYLGERAMDRFTRLCAEMGIASETIGAPALTAQMGPQVDDTLSNLLQMIEDTDCGLLFESRGQFGLGYRSNASMANQAAAVVLPYDAALLDPSLAPVFDQQLTRNNITVTNWTGYTQGAILTAGAMSVLNPPAGVGNGYAYQRNVSAANDSQLPGIANFLLNLGTVDEIRLPVVTLKMIRAANAAYFAAVPALRPGDYFQITSMPAYGGPATAKQLVQGYSETLRPREWTFTFNSVPETPWETGFSPGTIQLAQLPGGSVTTSQAPGAGGSVIANGSITPSMLNSGITVHTLGGNAVTISVAAPLTPNLNDMWIASATGLLSQWNGTSWVPVQFDASAVIQAGTITSALIRAGTIVAGNIAAGTITSALLAAGIVVAGIVDATTITGATFIATGTSGEYLGYSGTPAAGNLVFSVSPTTGVDAQGNAYLSGAVSYNSPGTGRWIAASTDGGTANVYTAPSSAGPWTQIGSVGSLANDGNIHFSAHGGAYLVADTIWYKQDPSGSGREAWHDMRPLANLFTGTVAGEYPPQYRLSADGCIELFGTVQLPGSGTYNGVTFFTLPAGYRPVSHAISFPVVQTAGTAATDTNAGFPRLFIDTTGACQFFGISPSINSGLIRMYARFPLDVTGLITS